ncbi:MAG: phosphoribosylformimino-5-aminoimidazole carboxamide ribotide isomerase [Chlorobi bacterium]|nr:phosphoribosylformimino-5-aminoimidazole carboxamide ribotide isomerase [Chlorobiota bacterium]
MKIYPAIDIYEGRCVRLRQGDFDDSTVYSGHPADVALRLHSAGFQHLHVVDLDGARRGCPVNHAAIAAILSITGPRVQIGGGVRATGDVEALLNLGADRVVIGSVAVTSPELLSKWIERFGAERILVAIDTRAGDVALAGWEERSNRAALSVATEMAEIGVRAIMCTDIERDGMLNGPNIELYRTLRDRLPDIELTASGGITTLDDLESLSAIGVGAAIVGKALHDGILPPAELRDWERRSNMRAAGELSRC